MTQSTETGFWQAILRQIIPPGSSVGEQVRSEPVSGGCINQAVKLCCGNRRYFIKLNRPERLQMFEDEADGLDALAAAAAIRTPASLGLGIVGERAYLALEYIDLTGHADQALAGRQLAILHRQQGRYFGWHRDNSIGSTLQPNPPDDSWIEFWQRQRLGHQLTLAASNGHRGALQTRGRRLLESLPLLLDHNPPPSLLHGDLWSGNLAYDPQGRPVIFDPAVYYGDREADLAMSELFGGFSQEFYAAYNEAWPLPPGYPIRKQLYNLYHILNHLNLFGGGYRQQSLSLIEQLLSEVG